GRSARLDPSGVARDLVEARGGSSPQRRLPWTVAGSPSSAAVARAPVSQLPDRPHRACPGGGEVGVARPSSAEAFAPPGQAAWGLHAQRLKWKGRTVAWPPASLPSRYSLAPPSRVE